MQADLYVYMIEVFICSELPAHLSFRSDTDKISGIKFRLESVKLLIAGSLLDSCSLTLHMNVGNDREPDSAYS